MIGSSVDAIAATPLLGPVWAAGAVVTAAVIARPRPTRPAPTALHPPAGGALAPTHRWVRWILATAVAVCVGVVVGPIALAVAGVVALLVRALRPILVARRRRADIERALPDAMDLLVLSVRAGLTPFQAVRDLAVSAQPPVGDAFGEVVRRTERGQPFADALAALPEQLGVLAGGLADVIATSDRHGLPLGPVLDQLTAEIRASRRRLDQAAARKLPVRLSFPLVVCTLPSFVLLAIAPAVIAALSSLGGSVW